MYSISFIGGATVSRRSTIGSTPNPVIPSYHLPNIGPGRSPQLPSRFQHGSHPDTIGIFHNPSSKS